MSVAEPHAEPAKDYPRADYPPPITPKASAAHRPPLSIDGILAILRHPLMVVFLSLAALIQVYRVYSALPGRIHEEDFADYYAAATIMRQGQNPYHTSLVPVGAQLGLHTKTFKHDEIIPETPAFLLLSENAGSAAAYPRLLDLDRD